MAAPNDKNDSVVVPNGLDDKAREFRFTRQEFKFIRDLVKEKTGISLSEAKRDMVYSRLSRRIRQLELGSFHEYCQLLRDETGDEFVNFVNAITTNLTAFFREPHHFEYLAKHALPELMSARRLHRRLRLWSAGCSTGEEPYSLAMVLREIVPKDWDAKLLATDLDSNVLDTAQKGIYALERVKAVSPARLRAFFQKGRGELADMARANDALREVISFNQLNLMGEWPMRGPFDVIFCRNVVIYFDKPTQSILFDRFANMLADDGYLFVGHSESLYRVTERFELIGQTIYRKRK